MWTVFRWIISWTRWATYMVKKQLGWLPPPGYETRFPLNASAKETMENETYKQVVEETPAGQVRMKHDDATNTFLYWTDRTIPHYYLDTVARKYVMVFDEREKYCPPSVSYVPVKSVQVTGPFIKCNTKPTYQIEKKMNKYKLMGKFKEEVGVEKINKKISFLEYKHGNYGQDGVALYKTE